MSYEYLIDSSAIYKRSNTREEMIKYKEQMQIDQLNQDDKDDDVNDKDDISFKHVQSIYKKGRASNYSLLFTKLDTLV